VSVARCTPQQRRCCGSAAASCVRASLHMHSLWWCVSW
jgi:hypothetical protein